MIVHRDSPFDVKELPRDSIISISRVALENSMANALEEASHQMKEALNQQLYIIQTAPELKDVAWEPVELPWGYTGCKPTGKIVEKVDL